MSLNKSTMRRLVQNLKHLWFGIDCPIGFPDLSPLELFCGVF